jgi:hypothetical protein
MHMRIEHLTRVMNKDVERGFAAHGHVHRLLTQFNQWPREALKSNPLKLPTLRILRPAHTILGLEFDRIPPLQHDNAISTSIRDASGFIDNNRQENSPHFKGRSARGNTTR